MITPTEKADELYVGYWYLTNNSIIAKQCALIAVNEMLTTLYDYHYDSQSGAYEYWSEVKIEIEKFP